MKPIPTISLWQPWASAIFHDDGNGQYIKADETRHWPTPVRGRILIHAAKKTIRSVCRDCPGLDTQMFTVGLRDLPIGALIGSVELVGCSKTEDVKRPEWQRVWGDYTPGRFAWQLANPIRFQQPIGYTGRQGWFNVHVDELGVLDPAHLAALQGIKPNEGMEQASMW